MTYQDLTATVLSRPSEPSLTITLCEQCSGPIALFEPLSDHERQSLVCNAWRVGLSAVMGAYRHAEESRLADLGVDGDKKAHESGGQAALFFALRDVERCAARSLASLKR